ncbi:hypothetical protein EH244_06045 [Variovorax beijingensis]|uniref:Tripartite tricarboxylate transporter family receptor n=1 Tax=Variovorax beijingensis TaxID=2496117 RepID=A0A3P3EX44_9BURK|nr:hypothetical protein EH244_06045 [Variovorax beijingensis]
MKADSGVDIISVPYKGGSQLLKDGLSGQFEIMAINASPSVLQSVKQGKLRVLAVTSPSRMDSLPNVPTLAELGHPSANLVSIFGLLIPAGVPESTAKELTSAVGKILADPEIESGIADTGNVVMAGSSAEFASRIASESLVDERIIKRAGIKAE